MILSSKMIFTLYHKALKPMRSIVVFIFLICFSVGTLYAQGINQKDSNGLRQGIWKKKYPKSEQLRYEGQFKDDKEIGIFKFYCESCGSDPFCTKEFKGNGLADVRYYTKDGDLVTSGQMQGKKRVGEWLSFHEKSDKVMTREFYIEGTLHGTQTTYYKKGNIIEAIPYVNGLKEGMSYYYAPDGIKLKELSYKNDLLDGLAVYYSATGLVTMKGDYKNGLNHGVWKYYKDGRFLFDEIFPEPEDKN
jgi:antitoxin component YwqK of YwqJK toxin-antitoxin module